MFEIFSRIDYASYWTIERVSVELLIVLNLLGSLVLGSLMGYERSYRGRAAGLRTFGLVSMASCALTIVTGYAPHWFGGHFAAGIAVDPTRVIQGIVTGIGFLGAGMIMKEGFTISGLSTAASIWACSAVGVMIGLGLYGAGIVMALAATLSMVALSRIEDLLPHHDRWQIQLKFAAGTPVNFTSLGAALEGIGVAVTYNSISCVSLNGGQEWSFTAQSAHRRVKIRTSDLAEGLATLPAVTGYSVMPSRH
jgi:putative Mg2+ transporter-C (MgtC) family protein